MKVNFADGDGPGDDVVARALEREMAGWTPSRGPDWTDLHRKAHRLPPAPVVVGLSSLVLVAVLVAAVVLMTTIDVGPFASHLDAATRLGR